MTLIVAAVVPSGIAISADSCMRSTVWTRKEGKQHVPLRTDEVERVAEKELTAFTVSNSYPKLFVVGRFLVALSGDLPGEGISPVIEQLSRSAASDVPSVPLFIEALFRTFHALPSAGMGEGGFVAGVAESGEVSAYGVRVRERQAQRLDRDEAGAHHCGVAMVGHTDVAHRLLVPAAIPFEQLGLQDVVDLGRHLIYTTGVMMRWELRDKVVGGPIDTVVITSAGARFVACHEVVAREMGPPPAPVGEAA